MAGKAFCHASVKTVETNTREMKHFSININERKYFIENVRATAVESIT